MEQLEKRFYSRKEIADILSVNINDNKHFKRNLENKLQKWGYDYIYSRSGVEIIRQPETAEERLIEIIIRKYDMDIQIDVYGFACFISLLLEDEGFRAMPWGERQKKMKYEMGIDVCESTLKKWCSKLLKLELVAKNKLDKIYWGTTKVEDDTVRFAVSGYPEAEMEMAEYMACRTQLIKEYTENALALGRVDYNEIRRDAWGHAFKELWNKKHTVYYCCSTLMLNAIGEEAQEIYELVNEIRDREIKEYGIVVKTSLTPINTNKQDGGFVF